MDLFRFCGYSYRVRDIGTSESSSLVEELRSLRVRRDQLRSDRDELRRETQERLALIERELGVRDAMIASITAMLPDLGDPSDSGAPRRRVEIGPALLGALVDANGKPMTIEQLLNDVRKRVSDQGVRANQVRDGARYLAKTDSRVYAERSDSGRITYAFRMSDGLSNRAEAITRDNAENR